MKAILDQMSQWESFVDVVNQVAEVIKMQQKVLKATEKARESRTQEVFDERSGVDQAAVRAAGGQLEPARRRAGGRRDAPGSRSRGMVEEPG